MNTPAPMAATAFAGLDDLIALLRREADRCGESAAFSALDHGLQCAHHLRQLRPHDPELHIAGLVHDIGHHLVPGDDAGHGRHGADAVRHLLGERVADLVELHVPAKRYLVAIDPAYHDRLSPVSVGTLGRQGGWMSVREQALFAQTPRSADAVVLRRCDEAAKVPGMPVAPLDGWIPALIALAASSARP